MIILKLLETQALHLHKLGIKCPKYLELDKGCGMCEDFMSQLEEKLKKANLI